MKYYLLIAGHGYYPQQGTRDWVEAYESYNEAESQVKKIESHEYFSKGPRKGEVKYANYRYEVHGSPYDWYEIVDLEPVIRTGKGF